MIKRKGLGILLNIFLLIVNLLLFATAGQYIYIEGQLPTLLPNPTPELINFTSFILNNEAAIYFAAASITALVALYNLIVPSCVQRGLVACNVQFYATLAACCMQAAVGVMSGIDTVVFEQNFTNAIANVQMLTNLQMQVMGCMYSILCFTMPLLGCLLYEKWSALSVCMSQSDAKIALQTNFSGLQSSLKRY